MENSRISNFSKEELQQVWKSLDSEAINKLILSSNPREIGSLLAHSSEKGVQSILDGLSPDAAEKMFSCLTRPVINRVLLLATSRFVGKLPRVLSTKTLAMILRFVSSEVRDRMLKVLSVEDRKLISEVSDEQSEISEFHKDYLSERFDNSLERESLVRIKEIEERERFLERRQRAREEQLIEQLEHLRGQVVQAEKELHNRQSKAKSMESAYTKKEQDLKENIRVLQEEHQKQLQDKIKVKVPEFVRSAIGMLEEKVSEFTKKSKFWSIQGCIALGLAIAASIAALIYGGYAFNNAAKDNIDWFFFCFLLIKGLVVVTLFAAWAKHAFNIGNAYMHESLKRSDRMHAINFGKLYLEVYGNDVSQADMKSIFENWNLESDSAFTKIKSTSFEPKILEQVSQIITAASNAAGSKVSESSKA